MSEIDSPPPRPNRRILFRLFRGFLVFVVLLIVTYLIADQILLRKVQRQREAFKERFGAVDFRDFIPERPAPEEDAGRVYLYAAGLMAKVDEEHGDWSALEALTKGSEAFQKRGQQDGELPSPDEIEGRVRVKLAAMDEAFSFVAQAREMARGSYLESYEPEDMLPVLEEIRMISRNIAAKAIFEAGEGNLEAAADWIESGLHLADTMREWPTLMTHMVRIACIENTLSAAEVVMNTVDGSLPLKGNFGMLLANASDPSVYRNALASEAAFGQSKELPLPRVYWSLNQLKMFELFLELDNTMKLGSLQMRREMLQNLAHWTEGLPVSLYALVRVLGPGLMRGIETFDRMALRCDLLRIATELRASKQKDGVYPDSLDELALVNNTPMPRDPFSGDAYLYRREGEGFVLYSVGPDQKDDSGVKIEGPIGDVVWTCVR
jgi:hypothetical protein